MDIYSAYKPDTQFVERMDNREVALESEGYGHVDTGRQTRLGYRESVGDEVVPDVHGVVVIEVGEGEGQEGGEKESGVHEGQHHHQPDMIEDNWD